MAAPTKRKIIQSIIDEEDGPWIVMKPSVANPNDPEALCVFENPAKLTEATVEIPGEWFQKKEFEKVRQAIHEGLEHARSKLKDLNPNA